MTARKLHLNAFLMGVGHHEAAWRHPRTNPSRLSDIRHYQQLARTAERGRLDSVFLADGLALGDNVRHNALGGLEPLTLLAALAAVTEHVGLIATVSTTYNEPFHVARKFASLDHISGGRAGWNIVTSAGEAGRTTSGSSARRTGTATPAPPSSWRSSPSSGTAGRTGRFSATATPGGTPTPTGSTPSTTPAPTSGSAAR